MTRQVRAELERDWSLEEIESGIKRAIGSAAIHLNFCARLVLLLSLADARGVVEITASSEQENSDWVNFADVLRTFFLVRVVEAPTRKYPDRKFLHKGTLGHWSGSQICIDPETKECLECTVTFRLEAEVIKHRDSILRLLEEPV